VEQTRRTCAATQPPLPQKAAWNSLCNDLA